MIQSVISDESQSWFMSPMITARVSEGLKAEVETLVHDTGLWTSRTDFIVEALDEYIKRYWRGDRYAKRPNEDRD